jgi:hypothetical protein
MGMELKVACAGACSLAPVLERLAASGMACTVLMVDGALVAPRAAPPAEWREVRLKTPQGMVSLVRRGGEVAVVVFGNADAALVEAQRRVAEALGAS